jgi:hypothetical protein
VAKCIPCNPQEQRFITQDTQERVEEIETVAAGLGSISHRFTTPLDQWRADLIARRTTGKGDSIRPHLKVPDGPETGFEDIMLIFRKRTQG